MRGFGPIRQAIAIATLLCFAAPQAEAIETYGAGSAAAQPDEGLIVQARAGRSGVHRGGMRHGMNRGGFNRGGHVARRGSLHRGNRYANRNFNRNFNRNIYRAGWGNWARPGSYWWPVGGAVAAGAAIGFVSAAAAASWAGAAPGPNLCWYYTDPSRRQGFWDACP
jgi:hypothetical protein